MLAISISVWGKLVTDFLPPSHICDEKVMFSNIGIFRRNKGDDHLANKVGSGELGLQCLVVGSHQEEGHIEVITEFPRLVLGRLQKISVKI